jgi:hypothetical protein
MSGAVNLRVTGDQRKRLSPERFRIEFSLPVEKRLGAESKTGLGDSEVVFLVLFIY